MFSCGFCCSVSIAPWNFVGIYLRCLHFVISLRLLFRLLFVLLVVYWFGVTLVLLFTYLHHVCDV